MFKKFTLEEKSWIKYDIANSAYTLTVSTVLFPILWALVSTGVFSSDPNKNIEISNQIFLWATVFISLVVAILAPILGSISDFKGYKMKLFKLSLVVGLIFGFLLCIPATPWYVLLILYTLATIGYTAANVFYDSLLVDVTEEENYNRVSSAGFAWGYIGSCIPFILGMIVYGLVFLNIIDMDPKYAISIAFFISMAWWLIFSLPMLRDVKQRHYIDKPNKWLSETFKRLWVTIKKITKQPKLFFYLISYFLFIDAVYTIIKTAVTIGESFVDQNGNKLIGSMDLLAVVFIVQVIAFPCAILFGMLAKKFGEIKMLIYGISVYIIICIFGYFLGDITGNIKIDLFIFAALIGSAQGGLQAVSRSYFGKLIPKEESGEYYGFFNIFGKFASVLGPGIMAITIDIANNTKFATLSLVPLLVLGFIFLIISNLKRNNFKEYSHTNVA